MLPFSDSLKSYGDIDSKLDMHTIDNEVSFIKGSKFYLAGRGCSVNSPA